MNPRIITLMTKAYDKKRKQLDELIWACIGSYMIPAVTVAVDRCLNGKKASAEYIKKAMFSDTEEDLTDEERDERELRQMIANEEAWIRASKQRGLPETII